jgi:hypothetical protein
LLCSGAQTLAGSLAASSSLSHHAKSLALCPCLISHSSLREDTLLHVGKIVEGNFIGDNVVVQRRLSPTQPVFHVSDTTCVSCVA